ncbi:MAG: RluA family pseudouridine synthase [Myxococcales bacterium]|nr:RluA family pseudouridine synthase [Myxococcales bacterium]
MTETQFTVAAHEEIMRLDQYLVRHTGLSRAAVVRLIEEGQVRIDGRVGRKGAMVQPGQRVQLAQPASDPRGTPPVPQPELALSVLYQDALIVVVNKLPGCATHPLRPGERGTLASALVARFPECAQASPEAREGGVCHRLDTYTSGAVIAARSSAAWHAVRTLFREGQVEKTYLAVVCGEPAQDEFEVTQPLLPAPGTDRHRRVIAAETPEQVYHPDALDAQTRFTVLRRGDGVALLRAHTATGRRHQVRAHLSCVGLPLLGDELYGAPPASTLAAADLQGYFLHADRVRLPKLDARAVPVAGGARLSVEAPLPAQRQSLIERLFPRS